MCEQTPTAAGMATVGEAVFLHTAPDTVAPNEPEVGITASATPRGPCRLLMVVEKHDPEETRVS